MHDCSYYLPLYFSFRVSRCCVCLSCLFCPLCVASLRHKYTTTRKKEERQRPTLSQLYFESTGGSNLSHSSQSAAPSFHLRRSKRKKRKRKKKKKRSSYCELLMGWTGTSASDCIPRSAPLSSSTRGALQKTIEKIRREKENALSMYMSAYVYTLVASLSSVQVWVRLDIILIRAFLFHVKRNKRLTTKGTPYCDPHSMQVTLTAPCHSYAPPEIMKYKQF